MRTRLSPEERAAKQKVHQRNWYEANKDKAKNIAKQWKDKNPEKANAQARDYRVRNRELIAARKRQKKYGISLEEQARLLTAQGNACAICKVTFKASKEVHTDHDHMTKAVRGFLCGPCNQAIGLMQDSSSRLRSAASYLENALVRVVGRVA